VFDVALVQVAPTLLTDFVEVDVRPAEGIRLVHQSPLSRRQPAAAHPEPEQQRSNYSEERDYRRNDEKNGDSRSAFLAIHKDSLRP
jgi:hypothetical protein